MSKIIGVTWHWTAGADGVNEVEKDSYNFIISRTGITVPGDFPPEAQTPANIKRGTNFYAAHTRNANSYRIGYAADAMGGAQERPLIWGPWPLTELQIREMTRFTAGLVRTYKLKVSRETILSHAEVERTLGIKQRAKWDITCLPGDTRVRDALEVGDILRDMVQDALRRNLC